MSSLFCLFCFADSFPLQVSKANYISRVFADSYKSPLSIILIDDLERVIDFVRTGPRFSNTVLQTLLVLLKKVMGKAIVV